MNKKNLWIVVIILLLIANIVFTVFMWGRINHHPPRGRENRNPRDFLMNELQMNDEQRKKYNQLADDHFAKKEELDEKERRSKVELFSLLKIDSIDPVVVSQKIALTEKIKMQIDSLVFYHFLEVKKICNKDQLLKIDEVVRKAIMHPNGDKPDERMGPPPPEQP